MLETTQEQGLLRAPVPAVTPKRTGEPKKLRRGAHRSVRQLNADIRAWIETWNANPRPFAWTKAADEILDSIARYCTTD